MGRFTLPRDLYHGKGALEALKTFTGKKAVVVVGGGSMKRFGFLDKAVSYLEEAGMEVKLIENVEPDPSVETVMRGAKVMQEFEPDWIVAMGGGSPIDAAKAMWTFYEYPDTTFEDLITPFSFPTLRTKARFCAISSTSGTATEVTAFAVITNYQNGVKYPLADFNITPDVAIVDPILAETLPAKLTAHTGMDAMTHAIEAYECTMHSVWQVWHSPTHFSVSFTPWRIRQALLTQAVTLYMAAPMQCIFRESSSIMQRFRKLLSDMLKSLILSISAERQQKKKLLFLLQN